MSMKEVSDAIRKHDNYAVVSHVNMEGDALGSQIALYLMLKQLGKKAVMLSADPVPERLSFMAHQEKVVVVGQGDVVDFDTALLADCPTIDRTGSVAESIKKAKVRINLDHHISNNRFGDFNWVDPDASSCGEMIFTLCKNMKLNINEDIAKAVYVAIVTDTGLFRYDSTSSHTHEVAAEILKMGIKPARIMEELYERKNEGEITLLAKSLATLKVAAGGRIAHLSVTGKMMDETKTTPDQTEGFVNYARSIQKAEISMFFREDGDGADKIHVSFRSKGKANVNVLASKFGGGGHPKASGCMLDGPLDAAIDMVVKKAEEFLL